MPLEASCGRSGAPGLYLYRSASIGFIDAAWRAGWKPKKISPVVEKPRARTRRATGLRASL